MSSNRLSAVSSKVARGSCVPLASAITVTISRIWLLDSEFHRLRVFMNTPSTIFAMEDNGVSSE